MLFLSISCVAVCPYILCGCLSIFCVSFESSTGLVNHKILCCFCPYLVWLSVHILCGCLSISCVAVCPYLVCLFESSTGIVNHKILCCFCPYLVWLSVHILCGCLSISCVAVCPYLVWRFVHILCVFLNLQLEL